jgi:Na+/H+ antiporter NhaC
MPDLRGMAAIALTGFLGTTLYFAAENYGVAMLPASTSSLIVGSFPAMALVLECLIDKVSPRPIKTLGIVLAGIIGLADGSFDIFGWLGAMGDGIVSMSELIIITMLAGGLLQLIKHNGGIDFIISRLTSHVNSKRGGELTIALLVSIVNLCTANNTVAIITVGGIARKIGERFQIDPRKCASLPDTFSCTVQGLIPYGAQILMAAGLAAVNPIEIVPHLFYPVAIGLAALLSIWLRYPRRYS